MPFITRIDTVTQPVSPTKSFAPPWLQALLDAFKFFKHFLLSPLGIGENRKITSTEQKTSYFNDEPLENEQKRTKELVVEILTAKPEKGISWSIQLKNRKAAACKAMEAFNKKAVKEYRFCEISFLNIQQLPALSYQEICKYHNRLLNPHQRYT